MHKAWIKVKDDAEERIMTGDIDPVEGLVRIKEYKAKILKELIRCEGF